METRKRMRGTLPGTEGQTHILAATCAQAATCFPSTDNRNQAPKGGRSHLPSERRHRKAKSRLNARTLNRPLGINKAGKHRQCFRCKKRCDRCVRAGCLPFAFQVQDDGAWGRLQAFLQNTSSHRQSECRYSSDFPNVRIIAQWAERARASTSLKMAVFGCLVFAHFDMDLRTFGALQSSFEGSDDPDWDKLYTAVRAHSGDCTVGAFNVLIGFRNIYKHPAFCDIVARIAKGISSFTDYESTFSLFESIGQDVPDLLGEQQFKLTLESLAYLQWLPQRWVSKWPVGPEMANSLRILFATKDCDKHELRKMLSELTWICRRKVKACSSDFHGTIGAALCWLERSSRLMSR